jgi:hypothetical protein
VLFGCLHIVMQEEYQPPYPLSTRVATFSAAAARLALAAHVAKAEAVTIGPSSRPAPSRPAAGPWKPSAEPADA